jgi:uncharacterized metal-binding protein/predicted Fe-Mo cluster-binding NifX family protein
MRYGIALLGDRVAPRSTYADTMLVVVCRRNHTRTETTSALTGHTLLDLAKVLSDNRIDILVCGGISREERDYLKSRQVDVIDNVAASVDELLKALDAGDLQCGFGLNASQVQHAPSQMTVDRPNGGDRRPERESDRLNMSETIDCLACRNRACLKGEPCEVAANEDSTGISDRACARTMEAALDIAFEDERTLCRLSELIYFCLEMGYERIGLAYCIDLEEPTEILVQVLRRFFKVYPVCCKIGGAVISDPLTSPPAAQGWSKAHHVACNPGGQVAILNRIGTDLNVLVGPCIGADCIFTQFSDAPVTTLFVKDKSLANNPIGAVYSDYYLKEAIGAAGSESDRET